MFELDPKLLDTTHSLSKTCEIYPYRSDLLINDFVLKKIVTKDLFTFSQAIQSIVLQFNTQHPSILPINGYCIGPNKIEKNNWTLYIKMPRMRSSLLEVLKQYKERKADISEDLLLDWFYSLVLGFEYLHKQGVVHQCVQPSNILLDKEGKIKISDLGSSAYITEEDQYKIIHESLLPQKLKQYNAPELCANNKTTLRKIDLFKADVWSFGLMILDLCLLREGSGLKVMVSKDKKKVCTDLLYDAQMKYSKGFVDILKRMLCIDPQDRKSFSEIREMLEKIIKRIPDSRAYEMYAHRKENEDPDKIDEEAFSTPIQVNQTTLSEKEEDALFKGNLNQMVHYLQETWKEAFEFGNNEKKIGIKAAQHEKITDDIVLKMLNDVVLRAKKYGVTSLQEFNLDLSSCKKLTDVVIKHFGTSIRETFNSLLSIHINLKWCRSLTDKAFEFLTSILSNRFKHLKSIALNFYE